MAQGWAANILGSRRCQVFVARGSSSKLKIKPPGLIKDRCRHIRQFLDVAVRRCGLRTPTVVTQLSSKGDARSPHADSITPAETELFRGARTEQAVPTQDQVSDVLGLVFKASPDHEQTIRS